MVFFSVDWGTTNCRIKLVSVTQEAVVVQGSEQAPMGVAGIYEAWLGQAGANRARYYLDRLRPYLESIIANLGLPAQTLQETPIIISGMASSSIGMEEIPYTAVPFVLDPPKITLKIMEAYGNPRVILLSGLRTDDNIMRGEETQLIGCWQHAAVPGRRLFIFPGTHSKHIVVERGTIRNFRSFVTGELLSLLVQHSTIRTNVSATEPFAMDAEHFTAGVHASNTSDLLENLFTVRCNGVLGKADRTKNYSFLVGLLLGHELKYLTREDDTVLCASAHLTPVYTQALDVLGLTGQTTVIPSDRVEQSAIRGQYHILTQLNY